jgi:uncharacterized protein YaiE (UPF0345 family)
MEYKGTWNAATNTPTLADGTGNQGDVYLCNVAGTVNFGSGPISFVVGDQVIYSGTIWQKASGATGTVTSVAVTESGDALTITGSPITTSGTINIGFAGSSAQYVAGDGSLINFPTVVTQAQNLVTEVYNNSGATMTKGTVVYINGGHGNLPTIAKAIATTDATSAQTYGVVRTNITNNNNGYVTVIGNLDNLDTQAYAAGTQLYLSSTTAGAWTSVKQYAPNHLVYVGIVIRSHPTQGVVEIRIQNGFELDELHDVSAQTPSNNQGIFYNSSTSLWENKSIATALGYTPISLTSLSATSPLSYNNTTGVFSISQASGSTSGFLSSTDWTTFNNKQNALTNPITGTGASGRIAYFNGTTTQTSSANLTWDNTDAILSTNSIYNFNNTTNAYMLSSDGENIGSIFNVSAAKWSLGYGTSATTLGTPALTWDNSGKVGIGTTSPSNLLDVNGTGRFTTNLFINRASAGNSNGLSLQTAGTNNWYIGSSAVGANTDLQFYNHSAAEVVFSIANTTGNVGIGTTSPFSQGTSPKSLEIAGTNFGQLFVSANSGATRGTLMARNGTSDVYIGAITNSPLAFGTNDTERMRITNGGLVGIGTSSPTNKLTLYNTVSYNQVNDQLRLIGNNSGGGSSSTPSYNGGIAFTQDATDFAYIRSIQPNPASSWSSRLGFWTLNGNGGTPIERMSIDNLGNVGIGNITPINYSGYTTLAINNATNGGLIDLQYNGTSAFRISGEATQNAVFGATNIPLVFSTNSIERMRIASGGDVLIGTTTAAYAATNRRVFEINGTSSSLIALKTADVKQAYFFSNGNGGDVYLTKDTGTNSFIFQNQSNGVFLSVGATSWSSISDIRLKNINSNIENAVDSLMTLKTINYSWKSDADKKENLGLIAQEVEKVFPQVISKSKFKGNNATNISEDDTEYLSVRYAELVPVLIKAIQELKAEIDELKNK